MVTDPIADMLVRIKNATMAGRAFIVVPHSKLKEKVSKILEQEGYITRFEKNGENIDRSLTITLKYQNKRPVITDIKRKSKPGLRQYVAKDSITKVL